MERRARALGGLFASTLLVVACSSDAPPAPVSSAPDPVLGSCDYEGTFSGMPECREYVGEGWTVADVESDCEGYGAEARLGEGCSSTYSLGTCTIEYDADTRVRIVTYGEDASSCGDQQTGCEVFGGGTWAPAPICGEGGGTPGGGNVFIQPTLECRDPVGDEPAGQGPDGQVCTWQAISGCTEEGRRFQDYASCEVVRTQRPYFAVPPAAGWDVPDPRLGDPAYVTELAWVREQIEASACVCCHSTETSPDGPSNWFIDAPGNWINTMNPSGLALGATWVDSVALGAYPPEDNNGFDRETSGFPSTDPARMRAFFVAELTYRGFTEADFADTAPFGGPIYDQLEYEPEPCGADDRIDSDGTIHWTGGPARYVQVLAAGSSSPTIPPNLDLPTGTRWRLDVLPDADPVESGSVRYGDIGEGQRQGFPAEGSPAPLTGESVYLYVARDVGIPITRCLTQP